MWPVKHESLVDHLGEEADSLWSFPSQRGPAPSLGAEENGLTGIGVPDPLVEDEGSYEIHTVLDFPQDRIGEEVVDRDAVRMHRDSRPEVQSRRRLLVLCAQCDANIRILLQKTAGQFDNGGVGHEDLQVAEERISQPLIDQDAAVLGIVQELDDIELAVITLN